MKYFKTILYQDGGPNDKGTVTSYIKTGSYIPKPKHNFEEIKEISEKEYLENLNKFKTIK